jgi:UDPglucose 6-dehydrogenase
VCGLWHLGSVTAACLAEHFHTIGYDPDDATVHGLSAGKPPLFEPGLAELTAAGISSGRLSFTGDAASAVRQSDIVWITFDTPVDDQDRADVEYVATHVASLFPHLRDGAIVLTSAQVPVGFSARMQQAFRAQYPDRNVSFAYTPENLRLGKALDVFRQPERIIVGVREDETKRRLTILLSPFCSKLEWMRVESAEMTKHALNAFLATSVTFINEIACICEQTGADAKEVERGLKTESRIGPRAYLGPGSAFAGGTLARDISFLVEIGIEKKLQTLLLQGVRASNDAHKLWPRVKLNELLGDIAGKTIAILGLTYKPGTDTLRRSSAVELACWIHENGAQVRAFDPALTTLPGELNSRIELCGSVAEALRDVDAAMIATEWPQFRDLKEHDFTGNMKQAVVLDPNRFLEAQIGTFGGVSYWSIGKGRSLA